jgi:hypothetical protein
MLTARFMKSVSFCQQLEWMIVLFLPRAIRASRYTARGHKLRFRAGFQRMALQSGKADRRRKIRFSVYPIRWKKKRGLCPWAV